MWCAAWMEMQVSSIGKTQEEAKKTLAELAAVKLRNMADSIERDPNAMRDFAAMLVFADEEAAVAPQKRVRLDWDRFGKEKN